MPDVMRFLEIDAFGIMSGRQLLLKQGEVMPQPLDDSTWFADPTFNAANELLASSGFKQVLESVLKIGFEIITTGKK